ncbi:hypothetical protein [Caudoviricetes sp.]|nr:hypothetical protein [Caudoviricetes sp.]
MYNDNLENLGFTFSNPMQKFFMAPAYASMLQMNPGVMSALQNNAAPHNLGTGFTPRFYQATGAQYQPYTTAQATPQPQYTSAGNPGANQLFGALFGDQINAIQNANPAQGSGITPRFYQPQVTPAQYQPYNMPQSTAQGGAPYGLLGGNFGGMSFSPQTGTMQPATAAPAAK